MNPLLLQRNPLLPVPNPLLKGEAAGHPFRGNQYTSGQDDGVTFYHGTKAAVLKDILKEGITAGKSRNFEFQDERLGKIDLYFDARGRSVYLTQNPDKASYYAVVAAKEEGAKPIILKVQVPRKEFKTLIEDEHDADADRYEGTIPPAWIVEAREMPKGIAGFEYLDSPVIWSRDEAKADVVTLYAVILYKENPLLKGEGPGHPFRGNQYTSGEAGGGMPADQAEATANLKEWADKLSEFAGGKGGGAIVAASGKPYAFTADSFHGTDATAHRCYEMATKAVLADRNLTYVEGYVSVHGVPIEHAWTVDKEGKVYDPTLKDGKAVQGYFGVPFKTEYLLKQTLKTKMYGMISYTNKSIFDEPASVYVQKGEAAGHPFRGNQYTDAEGLGAEAWADNRTTGFDGDGKEFRQAVGAFKEPPVIMDLPIASLRSNQEPQQTTDAGVAMYREMIQAGDDIGPITVYHYKGDLIVDDGHHRTVAAAREGKSTIQAEVYDLDKVTKGEAAGHPFRGNQYVDGVSGDGLTPAPLKMQQVQAGVVRAVLKDPSLTDQQRVNIVSALLNPGGYPGIGDSYGWSPGSLQRALEAAGLELKEREDISRLTDEQIANAIRAAHPAVPGKDETPQSLHLQLPEVIEGITSPEGQWAVAKMLAAVSQTQEGWTSYNNKTSTMGMAEYGLKNFRGDVLDWYADNRVYHGAEHGAGSDSGFVAMFSKDYEKFQSAFLPSWAMQGGTQAYLRAYAALKDFGPNVGIPSFYMGARMNDGIAVPSANIRANLERLYNETQAFYTAKFATKSNPTPDLGAKPLNVKRGVGGWHDTYSPAPVESWTTDYYTPDRFGKMMSQDFRYQETQGRYMTLKAPITYKDVLASYESMKGSKYWPAESELKGKKEFIVFGGALKNIESERKRG